MQREKHCLNYQDRGAQAGVSPMMNSRDKHLHESYYKNLLQYPFPEVYSFNLGWGVEPKRVSVLKTLIAIPQIFNLKELFNSSKQMSQQYVFRGMICYTEGGHYLSFFRRILIKVEHLIGITSDI